MIRCADKCRSRLGPTGATALAMLTALVLAGSSCAQSGEPIKIGYSMSLTGGLAPNGKSALLAQQIWEEDTNAKGGMLGRPVKLIYYDDKSSPSEIPPIYTKLLDIDKVDLIIGAYGTALTAPAMPIVIQRKKTFIGLLALAVNSQFHYPNYFVMIPSGPDAKPAFTKGFFDVAVRQDPKPRTVAIAAADQEFSRNAADGARENTKQSGLKLVYERTYPPATADFAPIVRAIAAANPDLVVVCSYPPDSVGMVRAANELGFKPKAIAQAVEATKTLDDAKLGDYIRAHPFTTVVGDVRFGAEGEWAQSRVLQVQYQNIKGNDIPQFKDMSTQVVVAPAEYASGKVIYPYERAK
jgi:branched-chain amino acid transport system substrate-binding protein